MNGDLPADDHILVNESIVDTMLKIPGLDREIILKVGYFIEISILFFS